MTRIIRTTLTLSIPIDVEVKDEDWELDSEGKPTEASQNKAERQALDQVTWELENYDWKDDLTAEVFEDITGIPEEDR